MSVKITVEHNGTEYSGQIMTIKSTMFGVEDHGIVTAYLHCSYPGGGVGVGGFGLDTPVKVDGKFSHREGTGYGLQHLLDLARTVGVSKWEDLPGRDIIVLSEGRGGLGSLSVGIASLDGKRVMVLKEHAENWRESHGGSLEDAS